MFLLWTNIKWIQTCVLLQQKQTLHSWRSIWIHNFRAVSTVLHICAQFPHIEERETGLEKICQIKLFQWRKQVTWTRNHDDHENFFGLGYMSPSVLLALVAIVLPLVTIFHLKHNGIILSFSKQYNEILDLLVSPYRRIRYKYFHHLISFSCFLINFKIVSYEFSNNTTLRQESMCRRSRYTLSYIPYARSIVLRLLNVLWSGGEETFGEQIWRPSPAVIWLARRGPISGSNIFPV